MKTIRYLMLPMIFIFIFGTMAVADVQPAKSDAKKEQMEQMVDVFVNDEEFVGLFLNRLFEKRNNEKEAQEIEAIKESRKGMMKKSDNNGMVKKEPFPQKSDKASNGTISSGSFGMSPQSNQGTMGLPVPYTNTDNNSEGITQKTNKKEIDIFMSFSCGYCWDFWASMKQHPELMSKVADNTISLWFISSNEMDGFYTLIYYYLHQNDPDKAFSFVDYIGKNRGKFKSLDRANIIHDIDKWLVANDELSILAIGSKQSLISKIEEHGNIGWERFKAFGASGTPQVFVDGKSSEDQFFFKSN